MGSPAVALTAQAAPRHTCSKSSQHKQSAGSLASPRARITTDWNSRLSYLRILCRAGVPQAHQLASTAQQFLKTYLTAWQWRRKQESLPLWALSACLNCRCLLCSWSVTHWPPQSSTSGCPSAQSLPLHSVTNLRIRELTSTGLFLEITEIPGISVDFFPIINSCLLRQ